MANPADMGLTGTTVTAADNAAKANNALWYTFKGIGRAYLVRRGSDASFSADTSGVHGYNTIEQAYTNPNGINPASQGTISQWNEQASLPAGGGVLGVIETVNITAPNTPGGQPSVSTQQNPTTAALGKLTGNWEHILLRVGEILLGLILVGVGLARLTHAQNAISKAVQTRLPV